MRFHDMTKEKCMQNRAVKAFVRTEAQEVRRKSLLDEIKYEDFFEDDPPEQSLTIFGRIVDVFKGLFKRQ